ncbi:hypothetical protein JCM10450v2_005424 [Rhodotorula kratochvilovae]
MAELAQEHSPQRLIVLAGVVGSGKSSLASAWQDLVPGWVRVNQDDLGDRRACEHAVRVALRAGTSVLVDRQNFDAGQRRTWLEITSEFPDVEVDGMVMGTSKEECRERLLVRQDHPTIDNPQLAVSLLNKFSALWEEPQLSEGFDHLLTLPSLPPPSELTPALLLSLLAALAASPRNPLAREQRRPRPRPRPRTYARADGFTDDGTWRPPPLQGASRGAPLPQGQGQGFYRSPPPHQQYQQYPQQQPQTPLLWGTPAPSAPGGAWAGGGWAPPPGGGGGGAPVQQTWSAGAATGAAWGGPPRGTQDVQARREAYAARGGYGGGGGVRAGQPQPPAPVGVGAGWAPPPPAGAGAGPVAAQLNGGANGAGTGAGGGAEAYGP